MQCASRGTPVTVSAVLTSNDRADALCPRQTTTPIVRVERRSSAFSELESSREARSPFKLTRTGCRSPSRSSESALGREHAAGVPSQPQPDGTPECRDVRHWELPVPRRCPEQACGVAPVALAGLPHHRAAWTSQQRRSQWGCVKGPCGGSGPPADNTPA
jgi:hypothetical protein